MADVPQIGGAHLNDAHSQQSMAGQDDFTAQVVDALQSSVGSGGQIDLGEVADKFEVMGALSPDAVDKTKFNQVLDNLQAMDPGKLTQDLAHDANFIEQIGQVAFSGTLSNESVAPIAKGMDANGVEVTISPQYNSSVLSLNTSHEYLFAPQPLDASYRPTDRPDDKNAS